MESDDDFLEIAESIIAEEPHQKHIDQLKKSFGHVAFRPMQWKVIRSVIVDRKDNCLIMATGHGKSLCFQYPAVYTNGVTVVVSPLISLMEDQVLSMNVANIPACLLGSAQKDQSIVSQIFKGAYRIVYVTPEYVASNCEFLQKLGKNLTLIAIDEAHCVSQWGHDFRPAFRKLNCIRETVPQVPIIAVTATATDRVRDDIIAILNLRSPQILCSGFDRPNLEFIVSLKGNSGCWADIKNLLEETDSGSTIIYCLTRKHTEEIVEQLTLHGKKCLAYHAGLSLGQRRSVHEQFVKDIVPIIVATIAFGMGIDKPDVRLVIHYGSSSDMEGYYQEVGRAGRDGAPAKCVMFHSRADHTVHQNIRQSKCSLQSVKENLESLSKKMYAYLNTRDCRRLAILRYFEGESAKCISRIDCCDNCRRSLSTSQRDCERYEKIDQNGLCDLSVDAEKLMGAIEAIGGTTGIGIPILLLRGSKTQKLNSKYYSHTLHGAGRNQSDEWWKVLAHVLEQEQFLSRATIQSSFATSFAKICRVFVAPKGRKWLSESNRAPLMLQPSQDMFKYLKLKTSPFKQTEAVAASSGTSAFPRGAPKSAEEMYFKKLLKCRAMLASDLNIMPYMIASNRAIEQMAAIQPQSIEDLSHGAIDGFSDVKLKKFGPHFIKCFESSMVDLLTLNPIDGTKVTNTHMQTFELWEIGQSVAAIAGERNIAVSTVCGHLADLIRSGYGVRRKDIELRAGVDPNHFKYITKMLPKNLATAKLSQLKENCLPIVSYDEIKLVLAYHHVRSHIKSLGKVFEDPDAEQTVEMNTLKTDEKPVITDPVKDAPTNDDNDLWGPEDVSIEDIENVMMNVDELSSPTEKNKTKQTTSKFLPKSHKVVYEDSSDEDGAQATETVCTVGTREASKWLSKTDSVCTVKSKFSRSSQKKPKFT